MWIETFWRDWKPVHLIRRPRKITWQFVSELLRILVQNWLKLAQLVWILAPNRQMFDFSPLWHQEIQRSELFHIKFCSLAPKSLSLHLLCDIVIVAFDTWFTYQVDSLNRNPLLFSLVNDMFHRWSVTIINMTNCIVKLDLKFAGGLAI